MAFVPVVDTMKGTMQWTFANQVVVVTLNFKKNTALVEADLAGLAAALLGWWTVSLRPVISVGATLFGISVQNLASLTAGTYFLPVDPPQAGTNAGTPEPANVAAVTTFRTALRGRSYRGRAFTPAQSQNNQVDPVTMALSHAAALSAAYADLSGVETGQNCKHVVVSRFTNGQPRAQGVATEVVSYVTDTKYDSQRRRLAGRGA